MFLSCCYFFACAISLGMAIWATTLLSSQGMHNGASDLVIAYMITECVMNYMQAINSVRNILASFSNADARPSASALSCLSLGTLIWNIVLLFRDVGTDRISDNPYYMYIFVQFLVNIIVLGVAVVMISVAACCMGFALFSEKPAKNKTKEPLPNPPPPNPYSEV